MNDISLIGLQGMQDGMTRAADAASRVVRAFSSDTPEDAVGTLLDLQASRRQFEASAAVVSTGQQLTGSLLDIFA